MIQYNKVNVKLSTSQRNKLNSAIKNENDCSNKIILYYD